MKMYRIVGWYCGKEVVATVAADTLDGANEKARAIYPGIVITDWKFV